MLSNNPLDWASVWLTNGVRGMQHGLIPPRGHNIMYSVQNWISSSFRMRQVRVDMTPSRSIELEVDYNFVRLLSALN